jgi:hypothetical protein
MELYTYSPEDYSRVMASPFDESDFVDSDYQAAKSPHSAASPQMAPSSGVLHRPPTREELESRVSEAQHKLAELKRAQEQLERERTALEDARRRRIEFQTGREEMLHHLTRGIGLLEKAEFAARREAEQMAKSLAGLRDTLEKIESIHEESWAPEQWQTELTRALTAIENGRLEWNAARLKWPLLNGESAAEEALALKPGSDPPLLDDRSFAQLCKLGLALTWPVAVIGFLGLAIAIFFLASS